MDPTPTEKIRVRLSHRERELILNETFLGGDLETRLRVAVADGKGVVVDFTLDDLDELLGYVAAEANHSDESTLRRQLYHLYDRLSAVEAKHSRADPALPGPAAAHLSSARFTRKQGQYLAAIYYYTKLHGQAPAEADLQKYFKVSAPSVHQMLRTLEARGLIARQPRKARSIRLLVSRAELPDLE